MFVHKIHLLIVHWCFFFIITSFRHFIIIILIYSRNHIWLEQLFLGFRSYPKILVSKLRSMWAVHNCFDFLICAVVIAFNTILPNFTWSPEEYLLIFILLSSLSSVLLSPGFAVSILLLLLLAVPGHALLWISLVKWKKIEKRKLTFLIY